jgi:hypothetical protein
VARGLAQLLVGGHHVEDVVHHLEGEAVAAAELGERVDLGPGRLRHQAADATGGGEQRGGLALDRRLVVTKSAVDLVGELQLPHLALAQPADGGGQQPGHLGPQRRRQLGRPGQQEVARQDGPQVAPAGVDALDPVAGGRLVDDVVVVQRPHVDQLAGHAPGDHVVGDRGRTGPRGRCQGGQHRPQPLAPGPHQMRGHLRHGRVVGLDRRRQALLDPLTQGGHAGLVDERMGGSHDQTVGEVGN